MVTDVVPKWDAANWTRDFFHEHYGKERVTMKAVDVSMSLAPHCMRHVAGSYVPGRVHVRCVLALRPWASHVIAREDAAQLTCAEARRGHVPREPCPDTAPRDLRGGRPFFLPGVISAEYVISGLVPPPAPVLSATEAVRMPPHLFNQTLASFTLDASRVVSLSSGVVWSLATQR